MTYDTGFWNMPDNYIPPDPPEEGSNRWKDDRAFDFAVKFGFLDKSRVIKLPKMRGYEMGYFVVRKLGDGTDYFRVDNITHYTDLMGEIDE